jgi:hypothetical protein
MGVYEDLSFALNTAWLTKRIHKSRLKTSNYPRLGHRAHDGRNDELAVHIS